MIRLLFGDILVLLLLIFELINYYDIVHNGGKCMVNILMILHVTVNHTSWCMNFGPVLVCSSLVVWIQE